MTSRPEIPAQPTAPPVGHPFPAKLPPPPKKPRHCYFSIKASDGSVFLPRIPPLGFLTQAKLFRRAQAGDAEAKKKLWEAHARLSYSVANRFRVRTQDVPDAIQAALLGLPRAIEKFDLARMNEFSTYAYHWVRQALSRHRQRASFFIQIPPNLSAEYGVYRRELIATDSRSDWFDARSKWLDENPVHYRSLIRLHVLAEPQSLSKASTLVSGESPFARVADSESISSLNLAVATLSKRERNIIYLRYGLDGHPNKTLEEIGRLFRLTRERVRQIQEKAEGKLHRALKHLFPEWTTEGGLKFPEPEELP